MRHDIVSKSCRICLKSETELVFIYKPLEYGNKTPSEMLQEIAGIVLEEVYEHPSLPKNICKRCIPSLNQAFRFRRKVLESERIISNHLLKECENVVLQAKQELEEEEIVTDEEFQYSTEAKQVEPEMQFYDNDTMEEEKQIENVILDIKVEEEYIEENNDNTAKKCNVQSSSNDGDDIKVSDSITNSKIIEKNPNESDSVAEMQKNVALKKTCDICGKSFAKRKCMKLHRRRHDTEFRHTCTKCDKRFKMIWELNQHKAVHSNHRPFVCNVCNKAFKALGNLKKHVSTHIGIKVHHCKFCNIDFLQRRDLTRHEKAKRHQKAVRSAEKIEKKGCNMQSFSNFDNDYYDNIKISDGITNSPNTIEDNLNENESPVKVPKGDASKRTSNKRSDSREDTESGHNCDICGKSFANRNCMMLHRRRHDTKFRHACTNCGKRFKMVWELYRHKTVHSDNRPYMCNVCNKSFKILENLQKHISIHIGIKLHHCKFCNIDFLQQRDLKKHEQSKRHQKAVEEEYVEQNSDKEEAKDFKVPSFSNFDPDYDDGIKASDSKTNSPNTKDNPNENDTDVNSRRENSVGGYNCDICGKNFANRKIMLPHRQRHDTEFRHTCSKCNKRFKRIWELHRHEIAHNDHRPYVCNVCSRSFKTSGNLQKHIAIHIGIKVHHCKFCNIDFLQRRDLTRHEKAKRHQKAVSSAQKSELERSN